MRTRFSLRLSPFTSFPFSQARKHNWPEYSLGPRSHLHRLSGYLHGTTVSPASSVRLSARDHGPTCVVGQVICLGPRSHLRHLSGNLSGTTVPPVSPVRLSPRTTVPPASSVSLSAGTMVPPASSVSLSARDHGPTCVICQLICTGPRSHLYRRSGYLPRTTVPPASSVRLSPRTMVPPASSVSLSARDHGPTCVICQLICTGPRSHLHRRHIIS